MAQRLRVGPARFRVSDDPLDPAEVAAAVADGGDGAVVTFLGLVRDHNAGRQVRFLEYEAFAPLAVKSFERIAGEAGNFDITRYRQC